MNMKQKTVIGIAFSVVVGMGLYPPWRFCGLQYGWLLAPLEAEKCFGSTFELATDRLFLQWGFTIVVAAGLVFASKGPRALVPLRCYEGSTFRFTKYVAPSEDWSCDHCAGCWAKFAEYGGPDVLHEGYVTTLPSNRTPDESQPPIDGTALIFVCARCFNQCRDTLDFKLESQSALEIA